MGLPSLNPSACIGKPVSIYALVDPMDQTPFYIGATSRKLYFRLSSHLNDACHLKMAGARYEVIRAIAAAGLRARIIDIETVEPESWPETEQFWIAAFRCMGARLTNAGLGGPGAYGVRQTEATRLRRRAAQAGRSVAHLHSAEVRQRVAEKLRGRKGKPHNADAKRKMSEAAKKRRWTDERRARFSAVMTGKRWKTGKPSPNRRPVLIDGIEYWGLNGAASALGVCVSTIQRWLSRGIAQYVDGKPPLAFGPKYSRKP